MIDAKGRQLLEDAAAELTQQLRHLSAALAVIERTRDTQPYRQHILAVRIHSYLSTLSPTATPKGNL